MRIFMLCGVLSLIGSFACMESREPGPDPVSESAAELAGGCCIDYECPADGSVTTGCKYGAGPSIREAHDECDAACNVPCNSSGLYCEER